MELLIKTYLQKGNDRMRIKEKQNENIITDRSIRDKCAEHYEVLEKVKELLLISGTDFAVIAQVADYYGTGLETIASLVKDNREELLEDGLVNASGQETKEILAKSSKNFANERGYFVCDGIKFNHRNNLLFPRRAILRVGMLLRDSEVAKEVRTQLLNIEEKASDETKTQDIDEEQSLMLSVGMAVASGDATAVAVASAKLVEFKNRHIQKLENDNKALAEGILEWKDRNKLNAGIRKLAAVTGIHFSKMWNELYKNLQYKYGICVKQRGGTPYIQWIDESEWADVMKTFCAMCEAYEQSPTEMLQQSTPLQNLKQNDKLKGMAALNDLKARRISV